MSRTTKIVSISIPPGMEEKLEELAKKEGRTRSELLREALRRYIEAKELVKYGRKKALEKGIREEDVEDIVDSFRR